jgi:hypothetical protein
MKRSTLILAVLALVGVVGWYLFRPERLFMDRVVHEEFVAAGLVVDGAPAATPTPLASGRFQAVRHAGEGVATIYRLASGERLLRLTEFSTDDGPDLYVYLVAAPDAHDDETVTRAGFVSLGRLKGNRGDQNYAIPVHVDLSAYHSVSIWCRRFGVNFVTAPLVEPSLEAGE